MASTSIVYLIRFMIIGLFLFLALSPTIDFSTLESVIIHPNIKMDIMNPFARDYRINEVTISIDSTDPDTTIVNESISYHLKGCFREVFRDLRGTTGKGVSLGHVSAYCEPECEFVHEDGEVIGRYGQICNERPTLYTTITYNGVTRQVDDAYEFHYTVWGGNWDRLARSFTGSIILPDDTNEVDVYFRPYGQPVEYEITNNYVSFDAINLKGPFEIIVAYGRGDNQGLIGREAIRSTQSAYEHNARSELILVRNIIIIVMILIIFAPLLIFLKFGREPSVGKASFSRDVPKDMKPYKVNLLSMGQTGALTSEAISATILDLSMRGHILLEEVRDNNGRLKKDVYMTFRQKDDDPLTRPEKRIYDFFNGVASGLQTRSATSLSPQNSKVVGQVIFWAVVMFVGFPIMVAIAAILGNAMSSWVVGLFAFVAQIALVIYGYTKMNWESVASPATEQNQEGHAKIKWSDIERNLSRSTTLSLQFQKMEKELKKEIISEVGLDEYYDNIGYVISRVVLLLGLIGGVLSSYLIITANPLYRPLQFDSLLWISILSVIGAIILLSLPNRVFGRFSPKGIEAHNRIVAFQKFIMDYSSLKRYPPSSLAIWDEIIVYATALGCAKNVEKHMRALVGDSARTPVSRAASIGMASRISTSVRSSSSSSGGGGRGGGRAGGGGGGAR